jgi:hypothetical protein
MAGTLVGKAIANHVLLSFGPIPGLRLLAGTE